LCRPFPKGLLAKLTEEQNRQLEDETLRRSAPRA
jgi:hypothetical protein